jgi:hypothetical protein
MGMNMVSKGVQNVLESLQIDFPDMDVIGISGNLSLSLNKLITEPNEQLCPNHWTGYMNPYHNDGKQ